jgi:O-antigen/teichoic acid export membrane protein
MTSELNLLSIFVNGTGPIFLWEDSGNPPLSATLKSRILKRKFVTNLALLLFLNLLVKPFWMFGIDRKVQNVLGAGEYGLYFSLFSLSILLNILLDAGIINFNNRTIARNPERLTDHLSKIVPLKLALAFVYAFIVFLMGFILGYDVVRFKILAVLVLNQFLLSFILYLRSNISGLHYFRTDSLLSVTDRVFMILICGVLLWGNVTSRPFQLEWFIFAQTVSYLLTAIIALLIVLSHSGKINLRFRWKYGIEILRQSYPFAILILLMSFFNRVDSVMMARMLPDGEVQAGIYAQGFRILDASAMFAFLFSGLLLPIFSRMIKQNDPVGEMLKLAYSLVIVPALTLGLVSLFFNHQIIGLLYHDHIDYSASVYRILIFGFVFISSSYIFGTLLTANGSLRQLNSLAAVTVILNLLLNLILIPRYKALGAAVASVSSQGFYAFGQIIFTTVIFRLKINFGFLIRLTLFISALLLTGWLVIRYQLEWWIGFFIMCASAVILTWVLGIVTPKGIYRILKYDV